MRERKMKNGFTLIELLLVVIIIGVLAAIMLPNFSGRSQEARITRAVTEIESTLSLALDMFEADTGSFPTTEEGLSALVRKPDQAKRWRGPYVKKNNSFEDPWDNKYIYQCPGQYNDTRYDLISSGPDGQVGTEDDISNYEDEQSFEG